MEQKLVEDASRQKFGKNAQNDQFWRVLKNLKLAVKLRYQIGHF